jgi:hypothetical protein
MAELSDRQVAHRRTMLEHLTQIARDRMPISASFSATPPPGRSGMSIVAPAKGLTHRVAMDTIAMDER